MTIQIQDVLGKAEDMLDQLAKSWPTTFNTIIEKYQPTLDKHNVKQFYIYTFVKKDLRNIPPTYTVYHQPRLTKPDLMAETVLRQVDMGRGTIEIIWSLPHEEAMHLYGPGKMFDNPDVFKYIQEYTKQSTTPSLKG